MMEHACTGIMFHSSPNQKMRSLFLAIYCCINYTNAFSIPTGRSFSTLLQLSTGNGDRKQTKKQSSRRTVLVGLLTVAGGSVPGHAADDVIWNTGKEPIVPGKKPRDKNDVSGTRKDPNFLRSIADCKSQCEQSTTSDGLARPKEDCLSECQDICCTTYQQCTFAIVPRI